MMYFMIFLMMMFGGLAVVFALLFGPGLAFVLDGKMMFLKLLYARLFNGMYSPPLLALPFFIVAGEIMNQGGITKNLVKLAQAFLGHRRGGLALVLAVQWREPAAPLFPLAGAPGVDDLDPARLAPIWRPVAIPLDAVADGIPVGILAVGRLETAQIVGGDGAAPAHKVMYASGAFDQPHARPAREVENVDHQPPHATSLQVAAVHGPDHSPRRVGEVNRQMQRAVGRL